MKVVYEYDRNMVAIDHETYVELKKIKKEQHIKSLAEVVDLLLTVYKLRKEVK